MVDRFLSLSLYLMMKLKLIHTVELVEESSNVQLSNSLFHCVCELHFKAETVTHNVNAKCNCKNKKTVVQKAVLRPI